jgi:NAD(P)-dependent dehydrogenase (short-subunit alcohol dehydrogenase family)
MIAVAERIHAEAGSVDLLINNAGVTLLGETADLHFAQWRRVLDINYLGTLHGIHCFYPKMVERGSGHIANIASVAGSSGYASAQAYATSKAAVIGFTRSLQVEAKRHGVRVTNVCPSYVETGIFDDSLGDGWTGEGIRATFMTSPVSAAEAAKRVLNGLRRGGKTVVFPLSGRLLYWMSLWCPWGLAPVQRMLLAKYRKARPAPGG